MLEILKRPSTWAWFAVWFICAILIQPLLPKEWLFLGGALSWGLANFVEAVVKYKYGEY